MISYLLHRLFADTCTVDMNGAAITITYYNEAPLTKVKPKKQKTCEHHSGEKEIIFHGQLLELYFLINSIKNIKNSIDRGKWVCHNYTNPFHFFTETYKILLCGVKKYERRRKEEHIPHPCADAAGAAAADGGIRCR